MAVILLKLPGAGVLLGRANDKGVHPMSSAAASGNAELVQLLLDAGASVTDTDANGATPLALAAFCGATESVKLLLGADGVKLESKDVSGATPLWLAAAAGHDEVVGVLLAAGARSDITSGGKSALVAATRNGHPKVKALLEGHASLAIADTPAAADDAAAAATAATAADAAQPEPQPAGAAADEEEEDDGIPDFEGEFDVGEDATFDPARVDEEGKAFVFK
jgi:hypothetical protein